MTKRSYRTNELFPWKPRDAEGYWLCRYCGKRINAGNRYRAWCSDKCREAAYVECSPSALAYAVQRRDRGVCAECGLNTRALEIILAKLHKGAPARQLYDFVAAALVRRGFNGGHAFYGWWVSETLWNAHHVVPVAEGGSNKLDNVVTLCVSCHKKVHAKKLVLCASNGNG